jgi:zinc transport system permease protein
MTMLELGFMQRALVACIAVSLVAPVVGTFVVQRRQSLIGDGMGHVAFAGVGVAFLAGFAPLWGATVLVVAGAVALWLMQRSGLAGDLALAMIFYGGIAFGYLLMHRSGMGLNSVVVLLFGSPLNLGWNEVWSIVGLAAVVVLVVGVFYRPLVAAAFDEEAARVSGIPTDRLALALTVVIGLIVVGGMYALGLLLVAAMLVVPVGAAAQVARSYRGTMLLAALIGGLSALVGLTLAFYVDLTPGASIVLTAIACYLLTATARTVVDRTGDDVRAATEGATR